MEQQNPYHAPEAKIVDGGSRPTLALEPAGRWRRFFNWAIDYACFMTLMMAAIFAYAFYLGATGQGDAAIAAFEQDNPLRDYAIAIAAILVYYLPLEGLFGFTIGKLITGTRVVDEQGRKPRFGRVVGRTLMRFVPFEPLSIFMSGEERRAWHDSASKTYVVRKR